MLLDSFVNWPPVNTGAFHGNIKALVIGKPVDQAQKLLPGGFELFLDFDWSIQCIFYNTRFNNIPVNVQAATTF